MIDNFTILASTLLVVYVLLRAAKLNRILPWFETKSLYEQRMKLEPPAQDTPRRRFGQVGPHAVTHPAANQRR